MDNEARNASGRDISTGIGPDIPTDSLRIQTFQPSQYIGSNVHPKTVGKVKAKSFETEYIEVIWENESLLQITPQRPFRVMLQFGKMQVPVYIQENGRGAFFRASNLEPGLYSINGASFRVTIRDDKPETKKRNGKSERK